MLSGVTRFRAGRVRAINLGGCIVEKPIVAFSQDVGGIGAGSRQFYGTIGMSVLQHFTTVFDYQHHVVAFKRNGSGNGVPEYDMTGIHVLATGSSFHDFTVDYVLTNSPAARTDIRVGDRIESANHTPTSQLTLDDLAKLFARPGSLRLTVSRSGRQLRKKLKLKPMI
jgi:C-terminal processing protease CtpA/Prc